MAALLDPKLESKLKDLEQRSDELSQTLSQPDITADMERFKAVSRAYAELQPVLEKFHEYRKVQTDHDGAKELLHSADDAEMRSMAGDEVKTLEARLEELDHELRLLLLPSDPNDEKNVVLEIRAGTGCTPVSRKPVGGRCGLPTSRKARSAASRRSSPSSRVTASTAR
jgi:peptide chain release factor 1